MSKEDLTPIEELIEYDHGQYFFVDGEMYEYNGVIHDNEEVYGVKVNSEDREEYKFNFSQVYDRLIPIDNFKSHREKFKHTKEDAIVLFVNGFVKGMGKAKEIVKHFEKNGTHLDYDLNTPLKEAKQYYNENY